MTAPRSALCVVHTRDSSRPDPAPGAAEKSCEKFFARRADLHAWQRAFPDLAARYFRASGLRPAEIAVAYGVCERTATNWLDGISRPNGAAMAQIALSDPDGFRAHFTPGRRAA